VAVTGQETAALLRLADALRRIKGIRVAVGDADLRMVIPGIEASANGRRSLLVFCHRCGPVGKDGLRRLDFCTSGCQRLGAADEIAQVAEKVRRALNVP
jgi:hypothetical protein